MTVLDYIMRRFSCIGEMTDTGASDFALDFGFQANKEATSEDMKAIALSIDSFIEKHILHPTSFVEGDLSKSWNTDSIKNYAMIMLKKYGITPNSETSALLGISRIIDRTDLW